MMKFVFWVFLIGILTVFALLSYKHVQFVDAMQSVLLKDMAEMREDVRVAKFGNSFSLARMDRLEAVCPGVSRQEKLDALYHRRRKENPTKADTVVVQ